MRQGAYKTIHSFFSHPDFGHSLIIAASLYCWFRSCEGLFITIFALTESAANMRVADFTASGDLHPAPKNIPFSAK